KTVAVQSGTNYINNLNARNEELAAAGAGQMNAQPYPKQTDAIEQLIEGRADATITQDTDHSFRESAHPGQFKLAYTYPDPETVGIYHRQDMPDASAALRETVDAMRDDGTTAAIAEAWNLPVEGVDFNEFDD